MRDELDEADEHVTELEEAIENSQLDPDEEELDRSVSYLLHHLSSLEVSPQTKALLDRIDYCQWKVGKA